MPNTRAQSAAVAAGWPSCRVANPFQGRSFWYGWEREEHKGWDVQVTKTWRPLDGQASVLVWQLSKHHNQHELQLKACTAVQEMQLALTDAWLQCVLCLLAHG